MVRSLPADADVAVVGAGAAGLATAIFARSRAGGAAVAPHAPRVILLEGARRPGAKILVSGGSRCNVTNVSVSERDYCTDGPRAVVRRVLRAFPVADTVAWFAAMGVPLHEEEHGKLFPDSNRSRDVLDALLRNVEALGVPVVPGARVSRIVRDPAGFTVEAGDDVVHARRVVLATGGRALPRSGSDGSGYAMATALGHRLVPTTPALAPLVLDAPPGDPSCCALLAGVTHPVDLAVWVGGTIAARFTGSLLWTHVGVSGPVALDASRHIERARLQRQEVRVTIGVVPGWTFEHLDTHLTDTGRARPRVTVLTVLTQLVPGSVASVLLARLALDPALRLSQMPRQDRRRLAHGLAEWELPVAGSRGYTYAEATAGGIDLREIDPATLESRVCPGLYLVGELLDVDGRLGGFNFQWAWASGRVAGAALAGR